MPKGVTRDELRCRATSRTTGKQCRNPHMPHQAVCRKHGGTAPAALRKAAERGTEQAARRVLARMDVEPVGDPLAALQLLAGQARAWLDVLAGMVNELTDVRTVNDIGIEQTHATVTVFERALDRCHTVLATCARMNIDDRLAAVTEKQAKMLENALFAAMEAAGIPIRDVETRKRVLTQFTAHLSVAG